MNSSVITVWEWWKTRWISSLSGQSASYFRIGDRACSISWLRMRLFRLLPNPSRKLWRPLLWHRCATRLEWWRRHPGCLKSPSRGSRIHCKGKAASLPAPHSPLHQPTPNLCKETIHIIFSRSSCVSGLKCRFCRELEGGRGERNSTKEILAEFFTSVSEPRANLF